MNATVSLRHLRNHRSWIIAEDEPNATDRHGLCPVCKEQHDNS